METMNFENIIGAVNGDEAHVLGKFLYFSLSHLLVEKDELAALCDSLNIPHSVGSRVSVSDAFRSATGDIRDRLVSQQSGETKIYAIYCRDNERKPDMYSRELVKETLNERTNHYQKLANLHYDRTDKRFGYEDLISDPDVDALKYCQQAEELFELYQRCANRRQIETICLGYLRSLEATKVSATGRLFFVPRHGNQFPEITFNRLDGSSKLSNMIWESGFFKRSFSLNSLTKLMASFLRILRFR